MLGEKLYIEFYNNCKFYTMQMSFIWSIFFSPWLLCMHIGVAGGYENLITSLKKIMFVLKNISYYMIWFTIHCLNIYAVVWLNGYPKILFNFYSYYTYTKFSPDVKFEITLLKIVMVRDNKLNIELNGLYKQ